jgi:hypothetical protein
LIYLAKRRKAQRTFANELLREDYGKASKTRRLGRRIEGIERHVI